MQDETHFSQHVVVIPSEGIEGAQSLPSRAKFRGGVVLEATDIGTEHGHSEHRIVDDVGNRLTHIDPSGVNISSPVAGPVALTRR